ncbi:MAG: gamma-glutamyl-gamma-aminobutyrate hydrolase family protein [Rhodobacteraceae bacterium]|jgi:putative glutamine amidotransferase|nr:gamma-glutamyl-gamma-aminobutyrate hydrolase [Paracoccaceae bacterium]MBT4778755.1 gamma-glutamyl-gamma-aminobutyrate hydrolase family protein [Paracoccaceae bacterium]MBT6436786.1 gamma-glutamyl-gamma-aminobutyrate hydrolase family protein [Paracoccaceae bacterium]|tara:strand:+ start:7872 stop:8624 length:753 start_codon:yes stop_codon:yes gene_type:complete
MARPIVGIIGNTAVVNNQYEVDGSGKMNSEAISIASGAVPLIFPANPALLEVNELLAVCDGFLLTGGRPNVHPEEYGEPETEAHGDFDRERDSIALPLVRACVERGQPIFGICRGFQEVNVAMGGSLYPEIRDLPGRMNHRMPPDGTIEEKFAHRHEVTFTDGGPFHKLLGTNRVYTNSLHGQGIKQPGLRVCIDGYSGDKTPEAMFIKDAPGFTLSVQWHPEYRANEDPTSQVLFSAFGEALNSWKSTK